MKICQQCGSQMPDSAEFCVRCGAMSTNPAANQFNNQRPVQQFANQNAPMRNYNSGTATATVKPNNNKKLIAIVAVVLAIVIIGGIFLIGGGGDESRIKSRINDFEKAINSRDIGDFADCLDSESRVMIKAAENMYKAAGESLDDYFDDEFGKFKKVEIEIESIEIDEDGEKAKVEVEIYVYEEDANSKDDADSDSEKLTLVKEDGDWYIDGGSFM